LKGSYTNGEKGDKNDEGRRVNLQKVNERSDPVKKKGIKGGLNSAPREGGVLPELPYITHVQGVQYAKRKKRICGINCSWRQDPKRREKRGARK